MPTGAARLQGRDEWRCPAKLDLLGIARSVLQRRLRIGAVHVVEANHLEGQAPSPTDLQVCELKSNLVIGESVRGRLKSRDVTPAHAGKATCGEASRLMQRVAEPD
jgi:hypothetical protein